MTLSDSVSSSLSRVPTDDAIAVEVSVEPPAHAAPVRWFFRMPAGSESVRAGPLRVEALVLDEDVAALREGQRLRFVLAAEPGRPREAVIERIRPMAELVEGSNVFRVVARVEDPDRADLRPSMEGWARFETGRTTWLMALLRDPVRWVRRPPSAAAGR